MAVKYKYPNEEEVIIDDANDYELTDMIDDSTATLWQAVGTFNDLTTGTIRQFVTNELSGNSGVIVEENRGTIIFWKIRLNDGSEHHLLVRSDNSVLYTSSNEVASGTFLNAVPFSIRQENGQISFYTSILAKADEGGGLVQKTNNLLIHFWTPLNALKLYTLKIFQDGSEIFSRTEPYPPEYVEIIEIIEFRECPENTCPVKCGENVCCYGSDGIATDSFLFSESIYQ